MPKQYYWLKLKEDFFRQKEIKKLRRIAGGDTYTIIYLKMLLLAIKDENKLYFEGVEDRFADELALELDEDEENVAMTLAFLEKHNLIEIINEEEFFLPQAKELTGSESESAARVRRHREKKKMLQSNGKALQCNTDVTPSNKNVTTEKEKEKEKELDIELDIEQKQTNIQANELSEFSKLYEQNIGTINQLTGAWLIEMSETIDFDLFKRGIEICTERGKLNLGYLKGIIKRWLDSNITTYEQLKAYELQMKANKNSDNKNYDISKEKEKEKEKPSVVQLQPFDFSEVRKELEEMGIEL